MHKHCKGEELVCLFVCSFVFVFCFTNVRLDGKTPGGYCQEFVVGVCRPLPRIPKIVIFHTRFQTCPSKIHPVLRPRAEIMSFLLRLERQQKYFLHPYKFTFFPVSSAGIETTDTLINSRTSLENQTRKTETGKVCTRFRPKRRKTIPFGAVHTQEAYIRE